MFTIPFTNHFSGLQTLFPSSDVILSGKAAEAAAAEAVEAPEAENGDVLEEGVADGDAKKKKKKKKKGKGTEGPEGTEGANEDDKEGALELGFLF